MEGDWLELEPALADRSKLRRRGSMMHLGRHGIGEKKNICHANGATIAESARKRPADVKLVAPMTSGRVARKKRRR